MGATFTEETVPEGPGSVHRPDGRQAVSGDWRRSRKGELARAFAGAVQGGLLGLAGKASRLKP